MVNVDEMFYGEIKMFWVEFDFFICLRRLRVNMVFVMESFFIVLIQKENEERKVLYNVEVSRVYIQSFV